MKYKIIESLELIIPVLISIAFITLAERKILGSMQRRQGPVKVGIKGLMQSIADGIKLLLKENIIPLEANKILYLMAPILSITLALFLWFLIPLKKGVFIIDDSYNVILYYAITSLSLYSFIFSGWASNSKYATLGSIRSISQYISCSTSLTPPKGEVSSYEISIGFLLMTLFALNNSFLYPLFLSPSGSKQQ